MAALRAQAPTVEPAQVLLPVPLPAPARVIATQLARAQAIAVQVRPAVRPVTVLQVQAVWEVQLATAA